MKKGNCKSVVSSLIILASVFCLLSSIVYAFSYEPVAAPVPMGDYVIYKNQVFSDIFYIIDPNGPEGLDILCYPSGLQISEPNIYIIDGFPESRLYAYPYTFTPLNAGQYDFQITATDSQGTIVNQTLHFQVKGNEPHIFVGCEKMGYIPPPVISVSNNTVWPIYYNDTAVYYQSMEPGVNRRGVKAVIYAVEK